MSSIGRVRGQHNSSLTRVRPFFRALFALDPTGDSWLRLLLSVCPYGGRLPPEVRDGPGRLHAATIEKRPYKDKILGAIDLERSFEYEVPAPTAFLSYLLAHPSELHWPLKNGVRVSFAPDTQRHRRALVGYGHRFGHHRKFERDGLRAAKSGPARPKGAGRGEAIAGAGGGILPPQKSNADSSFWPRSGRNDDQGPLVDGPPSERAATTKEGLAKLAQHGAGGSKRKWWAFEGYTEADCCLVTDRLVIAIEGKRNDMLSESTSWFPGRNQLIRNLEAVGEIAGSRACGVIVVCERRFEEPSPGMFRRSLPHLTKEQMELVQARYLGQITWRSLCEATGVPFSSLPDER